MACLEEKTSQQLFFMTQLEKPSTDNYDWKNQPPHRCRKCILWPDPLLPVCANIEAGPPLLLCLRSSEGSRTCSQGYRCEEKLPLPLLKLNLQRETDDFILKALKRGEMRAAGRQSLQEKYCLCVEVPSTPCESWLLSCTWDSWLSHPGNQVGLDLSPCTIPGGLVVLLDPTRTQEEVKRQW